MTRRRTEKPVERLRSSWTSTADLEETMAAMFHRSEAPDNLSGPPAAVVERQTKESSSIQGDTSVMMSGLTPDKLAGGLPDNLPVGAPDRLAAAPAVKVSPAPPDMLVLESSGLAAPLVDPSVVSTDKLTGALYQTLDGEVVDSKCIRPYDQVQTAHTPSEHVVYTTMWRFLAAGGDEMASREGILPMVAIAAKASLSLRNLRRVLRSLEAKLAIEVIEYEDKTRSIPRRYRVWGQRALLDRRRREGYTYIYRNRNLITLAKTYR